MDIYGTCLSKNSLEINTVKTRPIQVLKSKLGTSDFIKKYKSSEVLFAFYKNRLSMKAYLTLLIKVKCTNLMN